MSRDRIFALVLLTLGVAVFAAGIYDVARGEAKTVSFIFWSIVSIFAIATGIAWLRSPRD